jgi:hypothetical protein
LLKLSSESVVTDFWTAPASIDHLDATVKLHWQVILDGEGLDYAIHSDSWSFGDCLGAGDCLSASGGEGVVQSPPVDRDTTFTLDVITTDSNGARKLRQSLLLTVELGAPWISPYSRADSAGPVVLLRWVATGTDRCAVWLAGELVDDHAPADTYVESYPLHLRLGAPGRDVQMSAYGASSEASPCPFDFGDVAPADRSA